MAALLEPAFAACRRKWGGYGDVAAGVPDATVISRTLRRLAEQMAQQPSLLECAAGGLFASYVGSKPSTRIAAIRCDDQLFTALHPAVKATLVQPEDGLGAQA